MTGSWTQVTWNGASVRAWLPDPAATLPAALPARVRQQASRASHALQHSSGQFAIGWEPLARLLLRSEGVASSQIEEVRAPLSDVAAAELDPIFASEPAGWIVDNLNVMLSAVESTRSPLSVRALHRWHRMLMGSADYLPAGAVGAYRRQLGWVGGPSPRAAAHVGTPPDRIPAAIRDLVEFVNRDDVEPTVQAALAHAQFELVHPYADGNGRLGRVLISWILVRRLGLRVPPPVSLLLARDRSTYVGGLAGFREIGPAHWVRYFAEIVSATARATDDLLTAASDVLDGWQAELADLRPTAAARDALGVLAAHPVVSAELVAGELGVSTRTARTALDELGRRGIVEPFEPQRRHRGRPINLWVARGLIDVVGGWAAG